MNSMVIEIEYSESFSSFDIYDFNDELCIEIEPGDKENIEITSNGKKRKTDSKCAKEIGNQILNLNYNKIFSEMERNTGLDGSTLKLRIGSLRNSIEVSMWVPTFERFKSYGWDESLKLLSYIQSLLKIAREVGFNIRDSIFED